MPSNPDRRLRRIAERVLRDVPLDSAIAVTPYTPTQLALHAGRSGWLPDPTAQPGAVAASEEWAPLIDVAYAVAPHGANDYWRTVAGQPIVIVTVGGLCVVITPKRWRAPQLAV